MAPSPASSSRRALERDSSVTSVLVNDPDERLVVQTVQNGTWRRARKGQWMARSAVPLNFSLDLTATAGYPNGATGALVAALMHAMRDGQLLEGDTVPSTRTLSKELGVPRSVVLAAFEELIAAGLFVATPGGATRVEAGAQQASLVQSTQPPAESTAPLKGPEPSHDWDLRPGQADHELIDHRDLVRAGKAAALALGSLEIPTGPHARSLHASARSAISNHLRIARGMVVAAEDILLFPNTSSAVGALVYAADLQGASVAFEDPGYPKARCALAAAGARVRLVPVADDGIRPGQLLPTDRAVYVTPAHQYPLGGRLSAISRAEMLAWAQENNSLIIEDDYDGEFRYGVAPMPPIRSMRGAEANVAYIGTSSKCYSHGLRIAWLIAPLSIRAKVESFVHENGDAVSSVSSEILALLLESGAMRRHLARASRTYAARQSRFVRACHMHVQQARTLGIEAGLHVVLEFEDGLDDVLVAEELRRSGILCQPLRRYYADPAQALERGVLRSGLVCGYARLPESRADMVVREMSRIVEALRGRVPTVLVR